MPKFIAVILLSLFFISSLQAQDEVIIGLLNLEICNCISNDTTSSSTSSVDEFIASLDNCFNSVITENQSVLEQAWTDTTQEFSAELLSNRYAQSLGEELAVSCPAFMEKIQVIQANTNTADMDSSDSIPQKLISANKLMNESRCNEAIPVYSEIIRNPSTVVTMRVTAYNNRGVCRNEVGDYYRAISDLYVALEMNPTYAVSYVNLGESKTLIGDYNSALADLNYAIELNPQIKEAYSNRGFAHSYLGNHEQSIADFNRAQELDSTYIDIYFGKGNSYLMNNNYKLALENFLYLQSLSPYYPDLSYYLSESYTGLDMTREAIQVLVDDPSTKTDYINLNKIGSLYYSTEKYDSATYYYSRSIEIDSTSLQVFLNRAYSYQDNDKHKEAIDDFSKVLEQQQTSTEALMMRGYSYAELGDYDLAMKDYNQALSYDSTLASVYDYRARVKTSLEDFEGAIEDYSKSIEIYNADSVVFKERGENYLKINETEKACLDFNKAKVLGSEEVSDLIVNNCSE